MKLSREQALILAELKTSGATKSLRGLTTVELNKNRVKQENTWKYKAKYHLSQCFKNA